MAYIKFLAVLPFLGILVGTPFFNRVEPLIFGLPLILAWIVLWIILTGAIMAIIYLTDPINRDPPEVRR
jgi:xanthosine utilization system XapX-like protein